VGGIDREGTRSAHSPDRQGTSPGDRDDSATPARRRNTESDCRGAECTRTADPTRWSMACEQGAGAVHRYPIYSTSFRSKMLTSLYDLCPKTLHTRGLFACCDRRARGVIAPRGSYWMPRNSFALWRLPRADTSLLRS
jgi:hypothetical protein